MIAELWRFIVRRRTPDPAADPRLMAFARGLALGALVGAAIAGSRIWSGRRKNQG
jgi:hypothetical protein